MRGGDGVGPLWIQRGALRVMMGIHRVRATIVRFFAGDKPYLIGLMALLVVGFLIMTGPFNTYLDQQAQVETLREQVSVLDDANAGLAAQAEALEGPEAVELRAREEFGLIRPGEVPYVVVPPKQDRPTITTSFEVDVPDERSTLGSVWDALTGLLG